MGMSINTNLSALDAYRNLSMTQSKLSDSLQKLSSGYRINKAADDAAGLSISQGLQAQIGGLTQAVKNAQDGINVVQTADGALTEVDSILQRMNSLAVQAANTGSQDTTARQAAQTELQQLNTDLDNIGSTTQFGNSKLLDGSFGQQNAQVGTTSAFSPITEMSTGTWRQPRMVWPARRISVSTMIRQRSCAPRSVRGRKTVPTAMRPGNRRAASFTSAGSRTAAVPMMTRVTPLPSQPSTVAMSRTPPPSCSGIEMASRMRSTAAAFTGLPANAPSRSTRCR